MSTKALVLGGGGVAGIAWMTGLLLGLSEHGIELRAADRMIGTSAGSTVAAQIAGSMSLAELFARQVDPALQTKELAPHPHLLKLLMASFPVLLKLNDPAERTRRIGRLALDASTPDEATRRAIIAERLPEHHWPDQPLTIVAVDTGTGEIRLFDRDSQVGLVDAVGASCAVPGIWPPVTIEGRRYMDGGIRSSDNADLAAGYARVVVISPLGAGSALHPGGGLADQVRILENAGTKVHVVVPDERSSSAIGGNPFASETRRPTAQAGHAQGLAIASHVAGFWF